MRKARFVLTVLFLCNTTLVFAEPSPHAEALRLVLQQQEEEIATADPHNKKVGGDIEWWLDTDERQWIVKRPFGPGIYDSTHYFHVTLKIAGRTVGQWNVDTKEKKVSKFIDEQIKQQKPKAP